MTSIDWKWLNLVLAALTISMLPASAAPIDPADIWKMPPQYRGFW
jgi:hypothetical protein